MTLAEYVKKKNGVPFGHPHSLRNNLYRSLGAKNFPAFWQYWNPVFSYYLGTRLFRPLKKHVPAALALIITFVCCGLIHDAVTTVLRGSLSLFFSVWFLFMGIVVLLSKQINYDLSGQSRLLRAFVNLLIIGGCFLLTRYCNSILHFD